MSTHEEDLLVYDDTEAVKFILKSLEPEYKASITDIKIEYVLDVIYEYYDEMGLIDEDTAEEASIDEEEMFEYIQKCVKEDKMEISEDEIMRILEGEYQYGKSIGVYS